MTEEDLSLQILAILRDTTTQDKAQAIEEILSANDKITTLIFDGEKIKDTEVIVLADALKANNTIKNLSLNDNQIGYEGAIALAQTLKVNKTLTRLHLHLNQIGNQGASALADALKVNNIIKELSLNSNQIDASGASALADALKVNKTLTALHLSLNQIRDDGAIALAQALKVNNTIKYLTLRNVHIGNDGASALVEACKINVSVAELILQYNDGVSSNHAEKILNISHLAHTEITMQMLMLNPEVYSNIRLALVDRAPNVWTKIVLQNIYHLLERNTTLDLFQIFGHIEPAKNIHQKIIDQTKAYIDSRLAPDSDHVKRSDIMYVLAYRKHQELLEYLLEQEEAPKVAAKFQGTILSNTELCKFFLKPKANLNDDSYQTISEFLDFWDIAKLCIAKLTSDRSPIQAQDAQDIPPHEDHQDIPPEVEDLGTDEYFYGAAQGSASKTLGSAQLHCCQIQ